MAEKLRIDVWSDIACPWCYIGKRNLERGIAAAGGDDVDVVYHSYELAPDTPTDFEGDEIDFLSTHKGMPREQVTAMLDRVTGVARDAGLDYRFDLLKHTNTRAAHRLLHFAKENGLQRELAERLLSAYFTEGRHVGRDDDLVALAADVGLDADQARAALHDARYEQAVADDIARARSLGIQGVPFFVFADTYGVSGAQAPEAFAQVIERVRAERGA